MTKKKWIIVIVIVLIVGLGWFCYSKVKSKISNIENKIAQEIDKGTFDDLLNELESDEELQKYLKQNGQDILEEVKEPKADDNKQDGEQTIQNSKREQEVKQESNNIPQQKFNLHHNDIVNNNSNDNEKINEQQEVSNITEQQPKDDTDNKNIDQVNIIDEQKVDINKDIDEDNKSDVENSQDIENQELQNEEDKNNVSDNKQISSNTIKNLEKHVDIGDKKIGFKLASKVDVPYLMRLAQGGITADDKAKAKQHLKERLTADEYNQAKALIYKYLKLIGK